MTAFTTPIAAKTQSQIQVTWESVTPTRAKLWLANTAESDFIQRTLSRAVSSKYANEMAGGAWHRDTGDMIRIGVSNGLEVVVDGQHRLTAIAKSETPVDMFVARNVPLEAFKYIDQGSQRSLKDVMDCAGWEGASNLAMAGRYLWVHRHMDTPFATLSGEGNVSPGTIFDWLSANVPSVRDEWSQNQKLIEGAHKRARLAKGIMLFLWVKMVEVDRELAQLFFRSIAEPHLSGYPNEATRFAVEYAEEMERKILKAKAKGLKVRSDEHREHVTPAFVLAWQRLVSGKDIRSTKTFMRTLNGNAANAYVFNG